MKYVLTAIKDNSSNTVSEEDVQVIKNHLDCVGDHAWLDPGVAVDIFLEFDAPLTKSAILEMQTSTSRCLPGATLDVCCQPPQNRRKKLLIADMDSTIIQQECIDEIGDVLGLKSEIADITERAMQGELDFEEALIKRVGLLKGVSKEQLQKVVETSIELTPGAETLVKTMNKYGATTALISGGFTFFTSRIAELVGFQHNQANELLFDGEGLSGDVGRPILGKDAKRDALIRLSKENMISDQDTLAVGDGANDLAMIEEASLGVAYHAKPVVAASADAFINANDLTALLYFQGYKKNEFVS